MSTTEAPERIALVTGANTGIGRETARGLAEAGFRVIFACRSEDKARAAMAEVAGSTGSDRLEFLSLDLASLASVRRAAAAFLDTGRPLHLLINNAGLAGHQGTTEDGFEIQFGTNHLGHFLLTLLLLDRIRASAPARVVNVSSRGHRRPKEIDWDAQQKPTRTVTGFPEYCVSKLANVLFTHELARRLDGTGVTVYALHPGEVASDVWRRVPQPLRWILFRFLQTNEEGARTTLHCALDEGAGAETGLYYRDCKAISPSRLSRDEALAQELWRRSEAWVGPV